MEVVNFPLVFGREDLGGRRVVYTRAETLNPFYTMASQNGLKHDLLAWIRSKANILQPHDRVLIVFVSHGQRGGGNLMLVSRGRYEFLTKSEVIAALNVLPMNTRITILNEACYPSHWVDVAPQTRAGHMFLLSVHRKPMSFRIIGIRDQEHITVICSPSLGCGISQFTRMANCLKMCLASRRN